MGRISIPEKVKLFIGIIFSEELFLKKVELILKKKIGPIDFSSPLFNFDFFTDYYQKEMGPGLKRKFISFKRLIRPEEIVKIKLFCLKVEKRFSIKKKRKVNLDPGYLNEAKLILVTTKDFAHRIYLKRGVFSEVTLLYKNKTFQDLDWTFPDFRTAQYKEFFLKIRKIYREQIKDDKP